MPAAPIPASTVFLSSVEQTGANSGQVDLFNISLGGNTPGSDTFAAGSPAVLAVTNSTNENKPDVDNPVDLRFDNSGDLLIANAGTDNNTDPGHMACVPAGAIATGANASTTVSTNVFDPANPGTIAYDSRDGSVAIANTPVVAPKQLAEFILSPTYVAAGATRNLTVPGFGTFGVTEMPSLAAGTFAVALSTGAEEDTAHAGAAGSNKVVILGPTGTQTSIADSTTYSVDLPNSLAWDAQNNQLVIANFSTFHRLLSFYNVSPVSLAKSINTTHRNTITAASPDGHIAVGWITSFGFPQVQIYDNTPNRNPVLGPFPFNGTTTSCGSTYIYGQSVAINAMRWLSNTKLMVAVNANTGASQNANNGLYVLDISNSAVPSGFDDVSCSAFAAAPVNTGFVHLSKKPFGVAIRTFSVSYADPAGTCGGNGPCFTTIASAISNVSAGGVVNVFAGTYNEDLNLNNSNVIVNIDGDVTVSNVMLTAGTLNSGGGACSQTVSYNLTAKNNWTNNGGTFNAGGGGVIFAGSSAQLIGGTNATTFNNLTINNTSGGVSLNNDETVGGALTLTSGALGIGTHTLTLNGAASKTSGSLTSNATGTVIYNQQSDNQTVVAANYGNLTFSNFKKTLPNSGTVGIAGTFSPGTATGHTITGSTVEYNGTSPQSLPSGFTPYNNLTLNNTSGTTGFAGLTVNGLIEVKAGTFTSSSTYNNVQIDNGATLAGVNATTINVSGTWTNNGTFTANGNTVNFNGASLQSIGGTNGTTFNNLTINNAAGANLSTSQVVGNTLTLTNGVLGVGTVSLTLNGGTSVTSGSITSGATGIVNYNQAGNGQSLLAANYGNLTFSDFTKTLPNGSTVRIAGAFTTGATGGHTLTGSTIEFNGSSAQTLPSSFTTYNNLTLNNSAGTGGFDGLIVQSLIEVKAGTFTSGSATFKDVQIDSGKTLAALGTSALTVSGNWANNGGTFTANSCTVSFNGNNNTQTIGGTGTTTFNNLTSNHTGTGSVALGANSTINGTLTLTSDLDASTFTLTMPAAASSTGASDVTGNVKRIFPVTPNSTLSFGNPNNQIAINSGTPPTDITVNLVKAAPADFTTAVKRKYTITPNGGSGISATLRLHYNDADLNSNNESFLDLWRFGASWTSQGHTTRDANANWVELSGVTGFSPWTLATHLNQPPAVTNSSTFVNVQTSSGLVVTPAAGDVDVAYFKITSITNGTLFKHDGTTPINNTDFITVVEGAAGLKFTPTTDFSGSGSFNAQSSFDNTGTGLSGNTAAAITVNKYNTTTTITSDNPDPSNQGDNVTVNYSVINSSGGPTPTGNVVVTVSGGAETCTGTVGAGGCTLALTSAGNPRTITATYSANTSFNASSDTTSHVVNACTINPIVTSTTDSGANTLRDAVTNVCSAPNNNITFNLGAGAHSITLTTGELAVTKDATISNTVSGGNGPVTISGNNNSRVFNINSGKTVTIDNLTITGGFATGAFPANEGGAIFNDHGTLTISNSTVTGNTADLSSAGAGGGVFNSAFGGGNGSLTVINSTVSGNSASTGGGLYNYGDGGTATLRVINSAISGNTSVGSGGGISSYIANGGTAPSTLLNVPISGNKAGLDGGGIEDNGAVVNIVNGTITNNRSDNNDDNAGAGGGIHTSVNTFTLKNTIVAGNFNKSTGSASDDISGTVDSASSFNLIGTGGSGGLTNGSNQVGVANALLGALGSNGGPTQTHALLPGSPAIEAGTSVTTLSGSITDPAATSFNVADATAIPAGVGLVIQIDSEQMIVTAKSTNTLTVTRAANATTAATHADLAAVNPAFDQRGVGFPRLVNTIDVGSFEANYAVTPTAGTPQSATINTAFGTQMQATVTESGSPATGIPVTFTAPSGATASGTFSGSATVNTNASGVATAPVFTANGLAGGPYNVVASIASGQPTASFALTNTKANQAITIVTHAPASAAYNTSFTVAATSNSGLTVTYSSAGACTNVGASFTMTASTGTCTVKYDQGGDSNYNAATEVTESVTAQKANQAITISTHAPASAVYNASFTVAATSNSGLTVAYSSSGACTNVGATFTMTSGTGSCTVKYDQAGDSNYNAATQITESVTAQKANQAIAVGTHAPSSATYNTSFTVAATSNSGLTVTYTSSGVCTNVGATFTMTSGTGTCSVKYDQAGNGNYNAASQVTETVNAQKATQTITVSTHAPASATYNTSFTVAASSNSALTVAYSSSGVCTNVGATFTMTSGTGTCSVKYDQAGDSNYSGATQVVESVSAQKANQTITVNTHAPAAATYNTQFTVAATASSGLAIGYSSSGVCTNLGAVFTMTSGTGTCTVKYDQTGNANFSAAPQVTESVNAQKASQTITVNTHAPTTAAFNSQFTVAATASSGLAVTYSSAGSCTNSGATFTITASSGTCSVIYNQAGDANNSPAPQVTESVTAQKASQTITVNTHAPATAAFNSSFTVAATASSGLVVTYSNSGSCTNSGATFTITSGTGTCTVKYDQTGNGNFNAAAQVAESVIAQKAVTTTAITSSANPSTLGQSVTFTATVSSVAGTPTGTVQFKDGGTNLGALQTLNASGVAQATTSVLSAGSHTITADYGGDGNFAISAGTLPGGQVVGNQPLISFSAASYSVNESTGFITITVNRTGDTSVSVNVDYATDDSGAPVQCTTLNSGLASSRCDFTAAFGTLKFAANDTQKTFNIPINQDSYTEGPEMFTVNLSNLSAGAFAAPSTATVTINDSPPPATPNAIDDTTTFVRQQYHDFLNREPDSAGLAFWVNNIDKCNDPANRAPGQTLAQCIEVQRITTSVAFFLSIEFMQSGTFVRNVYVATLDRPATNNMPAFKEWLRDTQAVQSGVIVGQGNWQTTLSNNRVAFLNDFVMRPEFVGLYPTTDTPTQYVDKLYLHATVTPAAAERAAAIAEFGGAATALDPAARGRALLDVTQNGSFASREMNRAFVQFEYFGYLRRNPNDAPDNNFDGYNFWLNKLNQFNGDFLKAEMVKAFITSTEYRQRFGP